MKESLNSVHLNELCLVQLDISIIYKHHQTSSYILYIVDARCSYTITFLLLRSMQGMLQRLLVNQGALT